MKISAAGDQRRFDVQTKEAGMTVWWAASVEWFDADDRAAAILGGCEGRDEWVNRGAAEGRRGGKPNSAKRLVLDATSASYWVLSNIPGWSRYRRCPYIYPAGKIQIDAAPEAIPNNFM